MKAIWPVFYKCQFQSSLFCYHYYGLHDFGFLGDSLIQFGLVQANGEPVLTIINTCILCSSRHIILLLPQSYPVSPGTQLSVNSTGSSHWCPMPAGICNTSEVTFDFSITICYISLNKHQRDIFTMGVPGVKILTVLMFVSCK